MVSQTGVKGAGQIYRSLATGRVYSERARIYAARARINADKKRGVETEQWIIDIAMLDRK